MPDTVLAVDVGSRQVRAGLFDTTGFMLLSAAEAIAPAQHGEAAATYQMDEIWDAVCLVVRHCARAAEDHDVKVIGLAFDATSSLYVDRRGASLGEGEGDVFGWMDHRAQAEALEIDATDHPYLEYFDGSISPEFHLPKILWLKRNRPELFDRAVRFWDVCDELARRATGRDCRSTSALVCKWPYIPAREEPWCKDLLDRIGLTAAEGLDFFSVPNQVPASVHGAVSLQASVRLGVAAGTVVAVGVIDAEAGVLGNACPDFRKSMSRSLLMTGGTSTNFMLIADEKRSVPGVWGPFLDAVYPGCWLHEAGQSLSGGALDAVFRQHPASPGAPTQENHERVVRDVLGLLNAGDAQFGAQRHLVPDWLGNRAPMNNSRVRAIMSGIGQELDYRSFLETYYATARGIALQTRQIIEHFSRHGYAIDVVRLSGGHRRNPLLVRLYADCFKGDLLVSDAPEPVLLGAAMIAAVAAGRYKSLLDAADHMSSTRTLIARDPKRAQRLDFDYRIYLLLVEARNRIFAAATSA